MKCINSLSLTAIITTHMLKINCSNASIIVVLETDETHAEEITYTDPVFYKRNANKPVRQFIINLCLYHPSKVRCRFYMFNAPCPSHTHTHTHTHKYSIYCVYIIHSTD